MKKLIAFIALVSVCATVWAGGGSSAYINPIKWQDLRVNLFVTKLGGSSDPTYLKMVGVGGSQGVFVTAFAGGNREDEVYGYTQLPHGFLKTSIHPHLHCAIPTQTSATVSWGLEYALVNYLEQYPAATTIIYATQSADIATLTHQIVEFEPNIDVSNTKDSAIIAFRLFRNGLDAVNPNDTLATNAYALELDFHYQTREIGSDDEYGDND